MWIDGSGPQTLPSALGGGVEGVDFRKFVLLVAAHMDAIDMTEAFEVANVAPDVWARAQPVWERRLLDALESDEGTTIAEIHDAALGDGLLRWERRLPPLDEEVSAYMALERHLATLADPAAWLAAIGLLPTDLVRLAHLWRRRFAEDEVLRARAAEAALETSPPVARVVRGQARLRRALPLDRETP
ncbi:hypothetical protein [Polyangium jinanense]|uniref:Uncharacterized protein n=1 Tax=Polyangium jinanense TaxID=2829994 RepID=A0A9X3X1X2_9BACT|nr:hypothetical protein [Polyangium jinanense]MDC3955572.1 hypothetical protein [Polyangium jinanense]MDC3982214.1 hypothetical protein [Polyangium jinanense]